MVLLKGRCAELREESSATGKPVPARTRAGASICPHRSADRIKLESAKQSYPLSAAHSRRSETGVYDAIHAAQAPLCRRASRRMRARGIRSSFLSSVIEHTRCPRVRSEGRTEGRCEERRTCVRRARSPPEPRGSLFPFLDLCLQCMPPAKVDSLPMRGEIQRKSMLAR